MTGCFETNRPDVWQEGARFELCRMYGIRPYDMPGPSTKTIRLFHEGLELMCEFQKRYPRNDTEVCGI